LNIDFSTLAWGDADGVGTLSAGADGTLGTADDVVSTAGWVGWKDGSIENLRIRLRGDLLQYNKLLTIDTYTNASNKTFVRIGIPSMNVTMDHFGATVGAWTDARPVYAVDGTVSSYGTNFQEFGSWDIYGLQILLANNGGYVDISSAPSTLNGSGVKLSAVGVKIDELNIKSMTWGDRDGVGAASLTGAGGTAVGDYYTTAGYAGLANLQAKDINIDANLTINVATTNANAAADAFAAMDTIPQVAPLLDPTASAQARRDAGDVAFLLMPSRALHTIATGLYGVGTIGQSYVEFMVDADIHIGSLYTQCVVGPQADMRTPASSDIYGEFQISNLNVHIPKASATQAQSWVAIAAH
jgi:hypothetical protein